MKIGSASTSIAGQRSASVAARVQCVVTRCPSSAPVAAAIIAPEQTVTRRVERSMSAAIAATAAASSITARMPNPPGMISVSTGPGCVARPHVERLGVERDGALRRHRPAAQRHDRDVVALLGRQHLRRPGQHLGRSGDVERLDAVVHEDRHSFHGNTVRRRRGDGVNDTDPTIPAIDRRLGSFWPRSPDEPPGRT